MSEQHRIYLTRRNLLTLLSKLDRKAAGDVTSCTIVKVDNQHRTYPQTMEWCEVTAVEDREYYDEGRPAGEVHTEDDPWGGPAKERKCEHKTVPTFDGLGVRLKCHLCGEWISE